MRYPTILFSLCLIFIMGCTPKNPAFRAGLYYLPESSTNDRLSLQVVGYSEKEKEVLNDGISRALTAVLYQGIPDSPFRAPLISNAAEREKHRTALAAITSGDYDRFLNHAVLAGPPSRAKRKDLYSAPVNVTVNMNLLKRYLRDNGVLPRFGL